MKKLFAIFLAAVMIFGLTACGGDGEKKDSSVIELDGSILKYSGSELGKDAGDEDAIILHYNYMNGADEAKSFYWTFFYTAKQGETELEETIIWINEETLETNTDTALKDVEPGASKKVTIAFNIIDKTTPVVVTFTDLLGEVLGETTVDPANIREVSENENKIPGVDDGTSAEDVSAGLAGYYVVNSMNMEGEVLDSAMLELMGFTKNTYVVFRDDGTFDLAYGGEYLAFEYVDDGTFFNGYAAGTYEHEGDTVKVVIPELGFDATFLRSEGNPPEAPVYQGDGLGEELIAEFAGDWHGLSILYDCKGSYADEEGAQFEVVARFVPDIYGGLYPYIMFYANEGEEIENIEFYKQDGYIAVDVYGTFLGEDLYDSEIFVDDYGALYIMLHADDGEGNAFNLQACLRRLDDQWDSENDFPYAGVEFYNYYKGKSLEEILEIFGMDPYVLS